MGGLQCRFREEGFAATERVISLYNKATWWEIPLVARSGTAIAFPMPRRSMND